MERASGSCSPRTPGGPRLKTTALGGKHDHLCLILESYLRLICDHVDFSEWRILFSKEARVTLHQEMVSYGEMFSAPQLSPGEKHE